MRPYKMYGLYDEDNNCICATYAASRSDALRLFLDHMNSIEKGNPYYKGGKALIDLKRNKIYSVMPISY